MSRAEETDGTLVLTAGSGRRYRFAILPVPLACCALEVSAALDLARASGLAASLGEDDDVRPVLVVAGTVTAPMAPLIEAAYDASPPGTLVLAYGACASSGGPYWDSYSVIPGVGVLIPVSAYVPGCPPRPEALLAAVERLSEAVAT